MNCGSMRLNVERSALDAWPTANIRDTRDKSQRLTDGTR
jgi:hypothetical protein